MATMRETSVLFSLKQRESLEEARVREPRDAVRALIFAERRAAEEAERRSAFERSAQRRIEAERKARHEAERRAEEARIEAMRVAAVERARAEAEVTARVEVMRIVAEHERALAALSEDKHKQKIGRAVMLGAWGSILLCAGAFGLYFGKIKPDADARTGPARSRHRGVRRGDQGAPRRNSPSATSASARPSACSPPRSRRGTSLPPPARAEPLTKAQITKSCMKSFVSRRFTNTRSPSARPSSATRSFVSSTVSG